VVLFLPNWSVVAVHERKGRDTLDGDISIGVGVVARTLGNEVERAGLDVGDGAGSAVLHVLGEVVELKQDGAVDVSTCGDTGEGEDLIIEDLVAVEALGLEGGVVAINGAKGLEEVSEGGGGAITLFVVDDHDTTFGSGGGGVDKGEVDIESGHKDLCTGAVVVTIGGGDIGYSGKIHGIEADIETRSSDSGLIGIIRTNGGVANIGATGEGAGGAADGDRGTTGGPLEEAPAGGVAAAEGAAPGATVEPGAAGGLDRHLTYEKGFLCNRGGGGGLRGGRLFGRQHDDMHKDVDQ